MPSLSGRPRPSGCLAPRRAVTCADPRVVPAWARRAPAGLGPVSSRASRVCACACAPARAHGHTRAPHCVMFGDVCVSVAETLALTPPIPVPWRRVRAGSSACVCPEKPEPRACVASRWLWPWADGSAHPRFAEDCGAGCAHTRSTPLSDSGRTTSPPSPLLGAAFGPGCGSWVCTLRAVHRVSHVAPAPAAAATASTKPRLWEVRCPGRPPEGHCLVPSCLRPPQPPCTPAPIA